MEATDAVMANAAMRALLSGTGYLGEPQEPQETQETEKALSPVEALLSDFEWV